MSGGRWVERDICVYLVPLRLTPSPTSPAVVQPSHPDLLPYPAHSNSLGLINLSYYNFLRYLLIGGHGLLR